MSWYKLVSGQTATMRFTDGVIHERHTHWVDKLVKDCGGAECVYCKAGIKKAIRFFASVNVGGVEETWEFPPSVLDGIAALLPAPDKRAGASVVVTRTGEGLATRYAVSAAGPAPVAEETLGAKAAVARQALLASIHDMLTSAVWIDFIAERIAEAVVTKIESASGAADAETEEEEAPF